MQTNNAIKWPLWHWHFEVSSKCTLKCPYCPRSEVPDTLVQDELNLSFFVENFTPSILKQMKVVTFCGDDGDPIYAKDFLDIIAYIKNTSNDTSIRIVTNGSYKSVSWWKHLGSLLNNYDEIHWSVDGYDDISNNIYRVNSNFDSIVEGMKACKTTALKYWDVIYFKFNENKIDVIEEKAKKLDIDRIQITKSTKFGFFYSHYNNTEINSILEPEDKSLISTSGRFERNTIYITNKQKADNFSIDSNKTSYTSVVHEYNNRSIVPLCLIGTKGLFVNSQGYLIPCCWMANRYNNDYKQFLIPELNIKQQGLEKVFAADFWHNFFQNLEQFHQCNEKCNKKKVTEKYATEW